MRRLKAYQSHILTKKTAKRKRNLRRPTTVATNGEAKNLKRLLQPKETEPCHASNPMSCA